MLLHAYQQHLDRYVSTDRPGNSYSCKGPLRQLPCPHLPNLRLEPMPYGLKPAGLVIARVPEVVIETGPYDALNPLPGCKDHGCPELWN